jgi:hypothetical protein
MLRTHRARLLWCADRESPPATGEMLVDVSVDDTQLATQTGLAC